MFDSRATAPRGDESLSVVLARLEADMRALADLDLEAQNDRSVLDAAVALQRMANRHAGMQLRMLELVDRRCAHHHDGAPTVAAWYRARTRLSHPQASQQVNAAIRLRQMPRLRAALESGDITLAHVTEVTRAAVPRRAEALASVEPILAELARQASPTEVRRAVARVGAVVDDDGSDTRPLDERGPDERRELTVFEGVDGLGELRATLDPLDREALATLLDAFEEPDAKDTPPNRRRSPGQRRADAFSAMLQVLLVSDRTPKVEGYRAQILLIVDLLSLLGLDALADPADVSDDQLDAIAALAGVDHTTARRIAAAAVGRAAGAQPASDVPGLGQPLRAPRLRYTGETTPEVARRIAQSAKVQALLTLGPFRGVSVGRTMRELPPWLRTALNGVHGHCRGPDCDRLVPWSEAHHTITWDDGGDTDLNLMVPLCPGVHHKGVTEGTWEMTFDPDSGTCTWIGPDGQKILTHPPPL